MTPDWLVNSEARAPVWLCSVFATVFRARDFGFIEHASGACSIGMRDNFRVGEERWFHTLYPGLPSTTCRLLHDDFGARMTAPAQVHWPLGGLREALSYRGPVPPFPQAYKEFLSLLNGARLFAGHLRLFGVSTCRDSAEGNWQPHELISANIFNRPRNVEDSLLIVGQYPWDGSVLGMREDGAIEWCDRLTGVRRRRWSLFGELLLEEVERLTARFDERGQLIDSNRPTIPNY